MEYKSGPHVSYGWRQECHRLHFHSCVLVQGGHNDNAANVAVWRIDIKMQFRFAAGTVLLQRTALVWQRLQRVDVLQPHWRRQNLWRMHETT